MKNNAGAIILGAAMVLSVLVYIFGTRYQPMGGGDGSIDRFTGLRSYKLRTVSKAVPITNSPSFSMTFEEARAMEDAAAKK